MKVLTLVDKSFDIHILSIGSLATPQTLNQNESQTSDIVSIDSTGRRPESDRQGARMQGECGVCVCAYIYIYMYTHVGIHTYIHTYTHT